MNIWPKKIKHKVQGRFRDTTGNKNNNLAGRGGSRIGLEGGKVAPFAYLQGPGVALCLPFRRQSRGQGGEAKGLLPPPPTPFESALAGQSAGVSAVLFVSSTKLKPQQNKTTAAANQSAPANTRSCARGAWRGAWRGARQASASLVASSEYSKVFISRESCCR